MTDSSEFQLQLHKIQQKYKTTRFDFELVGQKVAVYKVIDIDELLDEIDDVEELPFWAELWPSSLGLATFILRHRTELQNKRLLELGAGVGLSGIIAALSGAMVTQSDFIPTALDFCRVNAMLNNVEGIKYHQADWRKFPTEMGQFDVIIGSDILYEKLLHQDLLNVFENHLKQGGQVLLSDPGRDFAKLFIEKASEANWGINHYIIPVEHLEKKYNINIYQLSQREL